MKTNREPSPRATAPASEKRPDTQSAKTPLVSIKESRNRRPWKIVSGGQTGVDRAGLAAAMSFSIETGGWAPFGRIAEDGVIPEGFYSLKEYPQPGYRARTRANVEDSDATLILVDTLPLTGGTALTAEWAAKVGRPCKVVCLSDADAAERIRDWMLSLEDTVRSGHSDKIVLNVAGPRESKSPGIFLRAKATLLQVLPAFQNHSGGDLCAIDDNGDLVAWMDVEWLEEMESDEEEAPDTELLAAEAPAPYDASPPAAPNTEKTE